ncbi:MAG: hypothetical protein HYY23_00890 [Verrucomicrobia bacterium]|nr:hypothetical protein [Verrucomicrobiota bacterium]
MGCEHKEGGGFYHPRQPQRMPFYLKRWAASHERGPGLPDSAMGRDAIYD